MSKKYIGQINNENFVYPNNKLAEYDVEIIHDLKENSVTGNIDAIDITYVGGNIHIHLAYYMSLNGAEPFISPVNGYLNYMSLHLQTPDRQYFKPWICVDAQQDSDVNATSWAVTDYNLVVTPQMVNQSSFSSGTYYIELRLLGKRCVFPISSSAYVNVPTPTPTPTPTNSGPTPTPGGPTPTPTPTATPTNNCYCYPIHVTGTTGGEGTVIASLRYNDCYGVDTVINYTIGPAVYYTCIEYMSGIVQYNPTDTYGIDQSYLTGPGVGNCRTGYVCGTTTTPTPTPTPTATSVGPTNTPTPTPTATSVGPTSTPTPTPTNTPYSISLYSGLTLSTACANVNGPYTIYYRGSLGVGTDLYTDYNCTVAVTTPGFYWSNNSTVYHVGLPSVQDGRITEIVACPTPTPTPVPTYTYNLYFSDLSGADACNGGNTSYGVGHQFVVSGNTTDFCTATSFSCTQLATLDLGNFWISDGTKSRPVVQIGSFNSSFAEDGSCSNCPTPTPTGTPTPTPTPTSTGYYYNISQLSFSCGGGIGTCGGAIGSAIGYSALPLVVGDFYNSSGDVYVITGSTTAQPYDMDVTSWAGYNYANCSDACQC
jgi:hypothetical protein